MALWTSHSVKSSEKTKDKSDEGSVHKDVVMTPEGKKMMKRALKRSPVIVTVTPGERRTRRVEK